MSYVPHLIVTCGDCNEELTHVCDQSVHKAFRKLLNWAPGWMPEGAIKEAIQYGYYSKGDEKAPFFSEAYLYSLLGKEDTRTILALIHQLIDSIGLDLNLLRKE